MKWHDLIGSTHNKCEVTWSASACGPIQGSSHEMCLSLCTGKLTFLNCTMQCWWELPSFIVWRSCDCIRSLTINETCHAIFAYTIHLVCLWKMLFYGNPIQTMYKVSIYLVKIAYTSCISLSWISIGIKQQLVYNHFSHDFNYCRLKIGYGYYFWNYAIVLSR